MCDTKVRSALVSLFVLVLGCKSSAVVIETDALRQTENGKWLDRVTDGGATRIACCIFPAQDWTVKYFTERQTNRSNLLRHLDRRSQESPTKLLRRDYREELESARREKYPFPFCATWNGWPYVFEVLTCTADGKETRSVFVCRNDRHNKDVVFLVSTPGGESYKNVSDCLRALAQAIDGADDVAFGALPKDETPLYDSDTGSFRPVIIRDFMGTFPLPAQH